MPAPRPSKSPSDSARATTPSRTAARRHRESDLAVFTVLLAVRIVNASTLRTFFQPDEFFQALEPAWQLAFGAPSNAWITWEWRSQLRSSLHPAAFAAVYRATAQLAAWCALSLPTQASLFIAAPKVVQAVSAALLDCYTWKLAEKVHGRRSREAFAALALSVCSPWQWFCSTRTLSNCLETTITSIAVYYWPWRSPGATPKGQARGQGSTNPVARWDMLGPPLQLRLSLLLAALACILRPTNLLIWIAISLPTLWQASPRQRYVLVREIFFCGSAVLACSALADRIYYGAWTLPPLRFLYFNIVQSLAVFYGRNRPDYYLTEGLPLLLTTALPFAIVGSWQALWGKPAGANPSRGILTRLACATVFVTLSLSLVSHKEVRFLFPVLPFLHVLCARPLATFFSPPVPSRRAILALMLSINLLIAIYTSQVHQRGVIDVLEYLRHKHEARTQIQISESVTRSGSGRGTGSVPAGNSRANTTAAFLMPCHSTPWRSHLVYPSIAAWALTCEPPIDVPLSRRSAYLDEADQFYINPGPAGWLAANMEDPRSLQNDAHRSGPSGYEAEDAIQGKLTGKRPWPQNIVFFAQLEGTIKEVLGGTAYRECWRGFNSHFHDDWRRTGDIVVWCRD